MGGMVKERDVPEFAGQIYTEVQRMIRLVEDIIRLSHLDEGSHGAETGEGGPVRSCKGNGGAAASIGGREGDHPHGGRRNGVSDRLPAGPSGDTV